MEPQKKKNTESSFDLNITTEYHAIGVDALEEQLRAKITEFTSSSCIINGRKRKGSYRLLAEYTGISQAYIHQFHSEKRAICITNMNKLANHFGIKYVVSNF
ncbi:helix-turn-helix domain-containing protein [Marinomonas spartinae]|uniref:helix-turn-helix domain-containing protein n=1 Tax=Marinomonas spartinae TaxID=1792290 RepID=UPI0018F1367A|nr:helix-turn-helix transcriptional regulator [Marinomonas spartinae]MBJ7554953.1 helix-turn-helix transcriptional regulator [Marinomonas spartinae]